MSWQPGGNFDRLYSWTADAAAGFDILADRIDADTNDIVQGLMRTVNLDGLTTPAANLPMGGFKHTNVAPASSPTDYARFDQVISTSAGGAITGNLSATGNFSAGGYKEAAGYGAFSQGLDVAGVYPGASPYTIVCNGPLYSGDIYGTGNLSAPGTATLGALAVTGASSLNGTVSCNTLYAGGLVQAENLRSIGDSYVDGNLYAYNNIYCSNSGSFSGSLSVSGGVSAASGYISGGFTVAGPGSTFSQGLVVGTQPGQLDALQVNNGNLSINNCGQDYGVNVLGGGGIFVQGPATWGLNVQNCDARVGYSLWAGQDGTGGIMCGYGAGYAGAGNVNVSGTYYRMGTPIPVLADALNDALRAAPEGAVIVITKQDGQVGARFIEVAEEDDTGRRMLFITGGTDAGPVPNAAAGSPPIRSGPQNF